MTFHFIKSSVHLTLPLTFGATCEMRIADVELNMAGLNIDFVGQKSHYSVSFHNRLTSPDITSHWRPTAAHLKRLSSLEKKKINHLHNKPALLEYDPFTGVYCYLDLF